MISVTTRPLHGKDNGMKKKSAQWIYCLERTGSLMFDSGTLTHIFRVIGRLLKRPISQITVKEAYDLGFRIYRRPWKTK